MIRKTLFLAPLLALGALTASAATFAQFTETNPTQTLFTLTNSGGSSISVSVVNGAIDFKFSVPNTLGTAFRSGLLNFSGTTSANATGPDGSGNLSEGGWSGSGSITDIATGTIALSWIYGPTGAMTVANGGTGGTFTDSRPPAGEVVFSSIYLNFSTATSESFSFGLSGATTPWSIDPANTKIASDAASVVGTFDAVPLPTQGTPEPTSMVLMGSALVAAGLFGRKRFAR